MNELEFEVLDPEIVVFNDAHIRVCKRIIHEVPKEEQDKLNELKEYREVGMYDYDCEVELTADRRFKTKIRVPNQFYAFLIGIKGSRRKKLEEDTKTQINIPKQNEDGPVLIYGPHAENVAKAYRQIEMISFDLRNRHQVTHFLSFPIIKPGIKEKFNKFKEFVLADKQIQGVDESIFQSTDKLHLTIGTMVLLNESEVREATSIMLDCLNDVIEPLFNKHGPMFMRVEGLEYMNDDPSQVDVLYATVRLKNLRNEILQKLCDKIVHYCQERGLMKMDRDSVKLHMTLMNTRYRKSNKAEANTNIRHNRISFDARSILKKFGNFYFGEFLIDEIHLSDRFNVSSNGYYESAQIIPCKYTGYVPDDIELPY